MFLRKGILATVAMVIIIVAAAPGSQALAHPAHRVNVWVKDQPRGHWDSVPVIIAGNIRYKAKWVWDSPSGHYEWILAHEPHPEYPIIIPVAPYYSHHSHYYHHRRR